MPGRTRLTDTLASALRAAPRLEAAVLWLGDLWYRIALFPFRRRRIAGRPHQDAGLTGSTDALNQAAEAYFRDAGDTDFLLNKPYSDRPNVSRHLINAGIIVDALRLAPGDTVVEFGAGTCWLSHILNLCGYRTISVDVSTTALDMGRRLFERDPRTNWSLEPRFERYDGHVLPLAAESVDRLVVNDAFHHVPNQREILTEMCRVLKPDGLAVMSEPGRGHSSSETSVEEVARSGVLENELVLEDVVSLARSCGFSRASVVVASLGPLYQVEASDLGAFMGGKRFARYWKALCGGLERHHHLVLFKAAEQTTRHPARLNARLKIRGGKGIRTVPPGATPALDIRIWNTGDTTWLHTAGSGWTRLGAHLYANAGDSRRLVDYDWLRVSLPRDVRPADRVDIAVRLPAIDSPGSYTVVFDMVVEGLAWFGDRGSEPAYVEVRVQPQ